MVRLRGLIDMTRSSFTTGPRSRVAGVERSEPPETNALGAHRPKLRLCARRPQALNIDFETAASALPGLNIGLNYSHVSRTRSCMLLSEQRKRSNWDLAVREQPN